MELQPEALPFHEPDRCPPSPASFHQPFCDCPATLVMTMAPSRPTCLYYDHRMPDPVPCGEQDVLDDLLDSAQRLAIEVINYPSDERDEAMQRIGGLLTDVACEAGCTHEIATEFRAAMEQAIRDYVAEIEASGGGTVAAWDVGVLMTGVDQSDDASEPALGEFRGNNLRGNHGRT
jgi:hypothetical protein